MRSFQATISLGIIHLVSTYLPTYLCVSGEEGGGNLRNVSFAENFAYVPNEWSIDGALELLHHYQVSQFFGELSQLF